MRSAELTHLLNEDADANERDKANLQFEKERRIENILNGEPDSLCEKSFFFFAQKQLDSVNDDWSESLDENAITFLLDKGFPKDSISDTIVKCSPTVPSKEDVFNLVDSCTRRAASCR